MSRGTFSQRHSVLVDMENGSRHIPLNSIEKNQAAFSVYDSMLSEAGVLASNTDIPWHNPGTCDLGGPVRDLSQCQAVVDLYIASGESNAAPKRPCLVVASRL